VAVYPGPSLSNNSAVPMKMTTVDIINSTTTLVEVPELQFSMNAGVAYVFEYILLFRTAAVTTGIRITLGGPVGAALVRYHTPLIFEGAGLDGRALRVMFQAFDDPWVSAGMVETDPDTPIVISGAVNSGPGGPITPKFASEVAGSAVTLKAGSRLR
jgi:hypothetical protein